MKPKRNVYQFSNFILCFFGANGLGILVFHFPAIRYIFTPVRFLKPDRCNQKTDTNDHPRPKSSKPYPFRSHFG